jgi:hypothetical protein
MMETLTLRVPKSWVGRLSASQVRAWIAAYLSAPAQPPRLAQLMDGRVSWRLPPEQVRDIAKMQGCSPGDAVRRVVAAGLRAPTQVASTTNTSPRRSRPGLAASLPSGKRAAGVVGEEILGEDPTGCVVIVERDARGFGYVRTLPMSRCAYLEIQKRETGGPGR